MEGLPDTYVAPHFGVHLIRRVLAEVGHYRSTVPHLWRGNVGHRMWHSRPIVVVRSTVTDDRYIYAHMVHIADARTVCAPPGRFAFETGA